MKSIDTLVIGSTAIGLAAVLENPADSLLIEASASFIPEWLQTYTPGDDWQTYQLQSDLAHQVQADMQRRNIQTQRGVHITGLAALMAKYAHETRIQSLFLTRIVQVDEQADGFDVHYINTGGHGSVHCKRIVDTTTGFVSDPRRNPQVLQRHLAFYLRPIPNADLSQSFQAAGFRFLQGAFANEASLLMDIDVHTSWSEARAQAHQFWIHRDAPLRQWNCVAMSNQFFEKVEPVQTGNTQWQHLPATDVSNALAGIDCGVSLAQVGVLS